MLRPLFGQKRKSSCIRRENGETLVTLFASLGKTLVTSYVYLNENAMTSYVKMEKTLCDVFSRRGPKFS